MGGAQSRERDRMRFRNKMRSLDSAYLAAVTCSKDIIGATSYSTSEVISKPDKQNSIKNSNETVAFEDKHSHTQAEFALYITVLLSIASII